MDELVTVTVTVSQNNDNFTRESMYASKVGIGALPMIGRYELGLLEHASRICDRNFTHVDGIRLLLIETCDYPRLGHSLQL